MGRSWASIRTSFFLDAYTSISRLFPEISNSNEFDKDDAACLAAFYFF